MIENLLCNCQCCPLNPAIFKHKISHPTMVTTPTAQPPQATDCGEFECVCITHQKHQTHDSLHNQWMAYLDFNFLSTILLTQLPTQFPSRLTLFPLSWTRSSITSRSKLHTLTQLKSPTSKWNSKTFACHCFISPFTTTAKGAPPVMISIAPVAKFKLNKRRMMPLTWSFSSTLVHSALTFATSILSILPTILTIKPFLQHLWQPSMHPTPLLAMPPTLQWLLRQQSQHTVTRMTSLPMATSWTACNKWANNSPCCQHHEQDSQNQQNWICLQLSQCNQTHARIEPTSPEIHCCS